jgi:hypothetical protein
MAERCQRRRGRVLDPPLLTRIGEETLWSLAAPGYAEGGFEDVGGNLCEGDAGGAFFAPAAWNWREDLRGVLDHASLLIGREQEDSEALMLECEGSEDFAGDAKVGVAEMGAFGGFGQRERDAAKGGWFHVSQVWPSRENLAGFHVARQTEVWRRKTARQASSVICSESAMASLEFMPHLID